MPAAASSRASRTTSAAISSGGTSAGSRLLLGWLERRSLGVGARQPDPSRHDAADPDAVLGQPGQRGGEPDQARLRHGIRRAAVGGRLDPGTGRDVDDGAAPAPAHPGEAELQEAHRRAQVEVEDVVPVLRRGVGVVPRPVAPPARVVDQDVDPAQGLGEGHQGDAGPRSTVTSQPTPVAAPPPPRTAAASAPAPAASRSATTTCAPASANARTRCSPSPDAPPVTTTVRSFSSMPRR